MSKQILFSVVSLVCCTISAFADNVTLTTYYPAPAGAYDKMRTQTLCVGNTCSGPIMAAMGTASMVVPNGSVVIGAAVPTVAAAKLEVVGGPIYAKDGLIVQSFDAVGNAAPLNAQAGSMWLDPNP